jgi:hypothetical protein
MNRLYEIFKTPSGPSAVKVLLNHTIFSLSQTGETVPLNCNFSEYWINPVQNNTAPYYSDVE